MTTTKVTTKKKARKKATKKTSAETDAQKAARLEAELAQLRARACDTTNGADLRYGPDYNSWAYNALKTELVSRGVVDRSGDKQAMAAQLQNLDMQKGLRPFMASAAPEPPRGERIAGRRVRTTQTNSLGEPTRDIVRIVDAETSAQYAIVYRRGKCRNGSMVEMDVEWNAKYIADLLNGAAG